MNTSVNVEQAKTLYPHLDNNDFESRVEDMFGVKVGYGSDSWDWKTLVRQSWTPFDDVVVGDGLTQLGYSDAHACTVVSRTPKSITVQRDDATLLNKDDLKFHVGGFSAHCSNQNCQEYSYERNTEAGKTTFTRRKDGTWRAKGAQHVTNRCNDIRLGRHEFYDYNF
tara:strand:+ start:6958 stop:7458 length:501 start_codon:yes stop_codon:yes gene_type:complete